MGISSFKVRLLVGVYLLLQLCAAQAVISTLCPSSHQYWSSKYETCINCSKCTDPEKSIVIRPCQGHVDTVCGELSDLNIDWSWLGKKDKKKHTSEKTHKKHSLGLDDADDFVKDLEEKKHHSKKVHKHHDLLDDPFFADEGKKVHHHGRNNEHKHHSYTEKPFDQEFESDFEGNKQHKKHHVSSESFLMDDNIDNKHHYEKDLGGDDMLESIESARRSGKAGELEKMVTKLLAQSKNRLQHRKEDLIKTLREEGKPENEKHLKDEKDDSDFNIFDDSDDDKGIPKRFPTFNHEGNLQRKPLSEMDLKLFEELINQEHKHHKDNPKIDLLKLIKFRDVPNRISHDIEHFKKHHKDEIPFPVDSFDYRSVVPTHRLFLGEPSTISEIMDQDFSDEKNENDFEKEAPKLKLVPWEEPVSWDEKEPKMAEVQFTAAERFVWDWQAVALTSAVAACLLFFAVVAIYSVLHARQWKRLKGNFNSDMEEMSARISLMQPGSLNSSAVDGSNANHYLENLLAGKKQSENKNIYIQKPSTS